MQHKKKHGDLLSACFFLMLYAWEALKSFPEVIADFGEQILQNDSTVDAVIHPDGSVFADVLPVTTIRVQSLGPAFFGKFRLG